MSEAGLKFEIYVANGDGTEEQRDPAWRWRLTAANGEIVAASSESFADRRNAENNAGLTAMGILLAAGRGEIDSLTITST